MLTEIIAETKIRVARKAEARPLAVLEQDVGKTPPPRDIIGALSRTDRLNIIAEIKRASPSAGLLREIPSAGALARAYQQAGAAAISVLTEENYFQGSLDDLREASRAVTIPVLQKDFICDPYQLYEGRLAGADAVLLIAAALKPPLLAELYALAVDLELTPLVEVHDPGELKAVLALKPKLLGINNRNLATLTTDIAVSHRLLPLIPPGITVVVESGLTWKTDLAALRNKGAAAFLVGETLVRSLNPAETLKEMLSKGNS